ncbi:MAG: nucleotidyltransferase domain-containing protein [Lachnospiraceae bacterium]|nr:nucleotidyltransferase domain-containing protein [Lachnospiraceae bacterium]
MSMNLSENIIVELIILAKKYRIKKMLLFGSRARGDNKERSDIDLAVSGGDIVGFRTDVDDVVRTLLMFDVVNLDGNVQEELLESIRKEGIILYEEV